MIQAKFIKPVPTKEGITLIFQAKKTKETMRAMADLMDEECEISLATTGESISPRGPIIEVMDRIHEVISNFYEKIKVVGADFNPIETELKELREEPLYQIPEKGESEE